MAILVWRHGMERSAALEAIQAEVRRLGHEARVTWTGFAAVARVGWWGAIVNAGGEVTDDAVVIDKCDGAFGGRVLDQCRGILGRLFPGGQQI